MHRHAHLEEFNTEQQINRMTVYAENLLFNVASGIFPGEYNQKKKPTKLKIAKPAAKKSLPSNASNSAKSTISRHMQKKKVNGTDPYGSWSEKRRSAQEKKKAEKNQM
jgi:hypothetical protein